MPTTISCFDQNKGSVTFSGNARINNVAEDQINNLGDRAHRGDAFYGETTHTNRSDAYGGKFTAENFGGYGNGGGHNVSTPGTSQVPQIPSVQALSMAARNRYTDNVEKMKKELLQLKKAMDRVRECCETGDMDPDFAKERETELMDQMENKCVQILALGGTIPDMEGHAPMERGFQCDSTNMDM
ncbi:hypothetical protein BDQ17DRAFT_184991 [Cyathus striatus]|nr:hypothetical protein BDQ17DRAFT_184991 [Cyathus striatus]